MRTKNKILTALTAAFVIAISFYFFQKADSVFAQVCQNHALSGWAWSENIGWISFSCKNQNADENYGVDINVSDVLSGYAWSENIGWISFNSSQLIGCPLGTCEARLNRATNRVSGWVKALAGGGANSGGWDGWIKLDGLNYGWTISNNESINWIWGSDDNANEAVVGWISLNCLNQGSCGDSDYKPVFVNSPPITFLSCDPVSCEGFQNVPRGGNGSLDLVFFATDPNNNLSSCSLLIDNFLVNNQCSGLYLVTSYLGSHNASFNAIDIEGASSTSSLSFYIRRDIIADFNCSLNSLGPFGDCSLINPQVNEDVYFQDGSTPSEGASITSWSWTFQDGDPVSSGIQNPNSEFTQSGGKNVTLTVIDNQSRTRSITKIIRVGGLRPKWKEVIPR